MCILCSPDLFSGNIFYPRIKRQDIFAASSEYLKDFEQGGISLKFENSKHFTINGIEIIFLDSELLTCKRYLFKYEFFVERSITN